jgi:hypothetical protein
MMTRLLRSPMIRNLHGLEEARPQATITVARRCFHSLTGSAIGVITTLGPALMLLVFVSIAVGSDTPISGPVDANSVCVPTATLPAVSPPPVQPSETVSRQDFAGTARPIYPTQQACSPCERASFAALAVLPAVTNQPIYLRRGAVIEHAVDVRLPGPVPGWVGTRSYSSLATGSASLGGKWLGSFSEQRLVSQGASDVALVVDATSKRVFRMNLGYYDSVGPADATLTLVHDAANSQFVLTNWYTGEVDLFHDFLSSYPGRLKERTTLGWRAGTLDGASPTHNMSNQITQVTTAEGQDYNIVFSYTGSAISKIEVRTGVDTSTRVVEVQYTYFNSMSHSADVGSDGDLVQVRVRALRSGGNPGTQADWIDRYTQYRYDSNGLLKGVFEADALERLITDRGDISSPGDILTKGDDDDNSGAADYKIREYAGKWFTYYTVSVKTDNSGAGTTQDPKCVTVWAPSGENLQSKYGGTGVQEADSGTDTYLVKSETVGGCSSCGSGAGAVKREYYYMQLDHGTPDPNEVVRLVVEDLSDAQGNGIRRNVYGLNDSGQSLREVAILDPAGTPQFWCHSKTLEESGQKLNRLAQERTPAAHNVSSSTVDEFLNPSHNGNYANDQATLHTNAGVIRVFEYDTNGLQTGELIKQGRTGTAYYVAATDYYGGSNQNRLHLVTAQHSYPQAETSRTAASRITTQYSYTFWDGTDTVKKRTATLPTMSSGENGSATASMTEEYFDSRARLRWTKDAAGYVDYFSYHPEHGHLAYSVRDVDPTSLPSSADSNSTKWVTSSDGSASSNKPTRGGGLATALAVVTQQEYDSQGRLFLRCEEQGGTIHARHYTVYETNRQLQFPFWDTTTNKPTLPIEVTAFDDSGEVQEQYAVDPERTAQSGGVPTGLSEGTTQSHYVRWARQVRDDVTGEVVATHQYHDIPSSGYGTKDTNYTETSYGHDAQGRRDRVVAPGGTITRTVFDSLGRLASQWIGTDDVPTSGSWSPSNNSGANMTKVSEYEYDLGNSGGNGNRTKEIRYVSDAVEANARVTRFRYDWRDRQVFVIDSQEFDSKVTYSRVELDHMGRATKSERYYDADDDESFPSDGTVDAGDRLLARSESFYDKLGRVYRSKTYAVSPSTGTVGSALVSDSWYDALGRAIKQQSGGSQMFRKTTYDALGRATAQYLAYDTDETAYGDASSVTGDTVLEQSEMVYDSQGNLLQTTSYARKHTAGGTGALTTSTARVTYTASWYDKAHRQQATANYGTNGGSAFSRPSTAPDRSDTVLVTSTEYNTAGQAYKTIDPAGKESRTRVRRRGPRHPADRQLHGRQSGHRRERRGRDRGDGLQPDGQLTTLTAKNPTTGDQVTKYVYGTDVGGITPLVYRNDLLRAEIYPDSDDTTQLGQRRPMGSTTGSNSSTTSRATSWNARISWGPCIPTNWTSRAGDA